MDVKTTNPIHHLIFGDGIVRGCTVLCVIDICSHKWPYGHRLIHHVAHVTAVSFLALNGMPCPSELVLSNDGLLQKAVGTVMDLYVGNFVPPA